jgi:hypothetical protein
LDNSLDLSFDNITSNREEPDIDLHTMLANLPPIAAHPSTTLPLSPTSVAREQSLSEQSLSPESLVREQRVDQFRKSELEESRAAKAILATTNAAAMTAAATAALGAIAAKSKAEPRTKANLASMFATLEKVKMQSTVPAPASAAASECTPLDGLTSAADGFSGTVLPDVFDASFDASEAGLPTTAVDAAVASMMAAKEAAITSELAIAAEIEASVAVSTVLECNTARAATAAAAAASETAAVTRATRRSEAEEAAVDGFRSGQAAAVRCSVMRTNILHQSLYTHTHTQCSQHICHPKFASL